MPNKFLIETALDIGITNLEKERRTDPKKLYEEVKKALPTESSPEIQELYKRYIALFEASVKTSALASGSLKEELKWKHIGDLREAVKNNGKGLSLADIEGLNQFALAEYGRQNPNSPNFDADIARLLTSWFGMYESLRGQSLDSMKRSYRDALKEGFLQATKAPFTIRYTEGKDVLELEVSLRDNTIVIGEKTHTLVGEKIQIGSVSLDADSLYIPYTLPGKPQSMSEKVSKKQFLDTYLDAILAGKDINIGTYLVRVRTSGELTPRTIVSGGASRSPIETRESTNEGVSLNSAIQKGFSSLVSGKKVDPLTVLHEGKKYRFPLEVDEKGFTLGGMKFTMNFPTNVSKGSFKFEKDEIILSGRLADETPRVQEILRISKAEIISKINSRTGEIVFQDVDKRVQILAKGSGEYLPKENLITEGNSAGGGIGAGAPRENTGAVKPTIDLKWPIEAYAGWNEQELAKFGKTIKDLQTELKKLGHYTGDLHGKYDIATLNAVVAFQKTKNIKVDGLAGRDETIPALFGISSPIATPRQSSRDNPDPIPTTPRPAQGTPRPSLEGVSEGTALQNLRRAMDEFRKTYKAVSEQTGTFYDTPEEIERYRTSIDAALKPVKASLAALEKQEMSKSVREDYNLIVLEIARYFSDGFSNIKNRHYRNYDLSLDLALSVIKDDLEKQKMSLPKPPRSEDVLAALKQYNPKLAEKIARDLKAGFDIGQILANPRVRGEFEEVYDTVYKNYESSLQALITKLRDEKTTFVNPSGYKALDMLIFIMGTTDTFALDSWKARNRDKLYQTLGMVGSTVAGVGAFMAAPGTGGASTILGGALLSGVVTTAGMVWTKGRAGNDRETWTEFGINTVTFGAGGALAKGANILMRSGTGIAKISGIALDAAGGLALGMAADHVRAWEADTNITLSESFKNNWYWALLPVALGMKGPLREKAERVQKDLSRAKAQALVGDHHGANETLKKLETPLKEVAEEARVAAPKAGSGAPKNGGEIVLNDQYKLHVSPDKTTFKIEDVSTGTFRSTDLPINRLDGELSALKIDIPDIHNQVLALQPTRVVTPLEPAQTGTTHHPETKTGASPEGTLLRMVDDSTLRKKITESIDGLKKDGSNSVSIGEYTIKREGSQYRVEGHDGIFLLSKKDALKKVERGLQENLDQANTFIRSKIDEHIKNLPNGKVKKYSGPDGEYILSKKKNGDIEVTGPGGKVLEGEALEIFYKGQAGKILDTRMKSFLDLHGDKPVGEVLHGSEWYKMQTFDAWRKWNSERKWYNPIWFAGSGPLRFAAEQIFDSLKAPLKTAEAFRSSAVRDHWLGGDGRLNGFAKAIVLRDAGVDWLSTGALKTVTGRGILMSGATAVPLNLYGDSTLPGAEGTRLVGNIMTLWSVPGGLMGFNPTVNPDGTPQTKKSTTDYNKTALSLFYGGAIWGTIIANLWADKAALPTQLRPGTWTEGAQIPRPTK